MTGAYSEKRNKYSVRYNKSQFRALRKLLGPDKVTAVCIGDEIYHVSGYGEAKRMVRDLLGFMSYELDGAVMTENGELTVYYKDLRAITAILAGYIALMVFRFVQ